MTYARPLIALIGITMIASCSPETADAADNTAGMNHTVAAVDVAPPLTPAPSSNAAVATPTPVASLGEEPTIDRTNRTGAAVLRRILVAAGQIDGKRITDFQLSGKCRTVFTTVDKTTTIDWSKVGNFAGRDEAGRTVLDIDDGDGTHAISVPAGTQPEPLGNASARVDGGFSVIADSCAG